MILTSPLSLSNTQHTHFTMILLKSSALQNLMTGGLLELQEALQTAIELEHSTIPPYLYAMHSLGTDPANATVSDIIGSVVGEEMLHMTLACNVLNAIGGHPVIDSPAFIPNYPTALPGGVENGLIVELAPFSIELLKTVFMEIEDPQDPINFPNPHLLAAGNAPDGVTIGQFYNGIIQKMEQLGPTIFIGDPALQVVPPFPEGTIVTDMASAITSLEMIIDQGEGSSATSPLAGGPDSELAHYYKYAEIVEGYALVPDSTCPQGFSYSGAPIVASGPVANVPTNPKTALYAAGTAERHAMDSFNYTYTSLLKGLHDLFNGKPETFPKTLGIMMSVRQQALDMMAGTNLHQPIGPSFEYQPVNPAGQPALLWATGAPATA